MTTSPSDQAKSKMKAAIEHFQQELKGLRTGRANPALLDNVHVDVYGSQMRLRDIASVTTPEPRQLLITPYDPQNTSAIGKAIEKANLNIQPIVEANLVRLMIPPMSEELRKEMVKECKKLCEKGKITIRNIRKECNDIVKKQKTDGDISEDQVKTLEKAVQDFTDKFCKEADDFAAAKEKEILTI